MSGATTTKSPTAMQRVSRAADTIAQSLHLNNPKWVAAAYAEIAAEEVSRNPSFAVRVRNRYDELVPAPRRRGGASHTTEPKAPKRVLVPRKTIETGEVNIAAALDPYRLYDIYGAHQLADALREYTLASLKEAVEFVQERHPDTKPKNKSQREPIIDYVVRYVVADGEAR